MPLLPPRTACKGIEKHLQSLIVIGLHIAFGYAHSSRHSQVVLLVALCLLVRVVGLKVIVHLTHRCFRSFYSECKVVCSTWLQRSSVAYSGQSGSCTHSVGTLAVVESVGPRAAQGGSVAHVLHLRCDGEGAQCIDGLWHDEFRDCQIGLSLHGEVEYGTLLLVTCTIGFHLPRIGCTGHTLQIDAVGGAFSLAPLGIYVGTLPVEGVAATGQTAQSCPADELVAEVYLASVGR